MTTTEAERVVMEAIRDLEQNLDSLSLKSRRNYHLRRRHFLRQALLTERRRGLEAQVMDVTQWANSTFGTATWSRQLLRAKEELEEVEQCLDYLDDFSKLAEEVADVIICLFRILGDTGHPDMIAKKMDINKARQWKVGPDGCAYHVKAQATPTREEKP